MTCWLLFVAEIISFPMLNGNDGIRRKRRTGSRKPLMKPAKGKREIETNIHEMEGSVFYSKILQKKILITTSLFEFVLIFRPAAD